MSGADVPKSGVIRGTATPAEVTAALVEASRRAQAHDAANVAFAQALQDRLPRYREQAPIPDLLGGAP